MKKPEFCRTCGDLSSLNDQGECTNCQVNTEKMNKELRELTPEKIRIIQEQIKPYLED